MNKQEILEGLNFRHACKMFDEDKKISEEDFNLILESGRLSPSSMGIEPWKFMILQNKEIRQEVANVSWGGATQIPSASHVVVILNRKAADLKYNSEYIDELLKIKQIPEEYQEKMKQIMKSIEDTRFVNRDDLMDQYSREQVYIPMTTMMDTAAMMKIDSCPIGGIDKEKVEEILEKNNILDKNHFEVALVVAFGYRVSEPAPKTRRAMEDVVEWVK